MSAAQTENLWETPSILSVTEHNFIAVTWQKPSNLCKLHSDVFFEGKVKKHLRKYSEKPQQLVKDALIITLEMSDLQKNHLRWILTSANFFYLLFVLYLTSIKVPSKTYSVPYRSTMVNTTGSSKIAHYKIITFSVVSSITKVKLGWKILIKIDKIDYSLFVWYLHLPWYFHLSLGLHMNNTLR